MDLRDRLVDLLASEGGLPRKLAGELADKILAMEPIATAMSLIKAAKALGNDSA